MGIRLPRSFWKPLIALYERDVMFTFRMVDPNHPENQARIAELSPTGQFPALIDGDMEIAQSNAIIEYLDLFHGEAAPMVPNNPHDREARMMADVFDDYAHTPWRRILVESLCAQGIANDPLHWRLGHARRVTATCSSDPVWPRVTSADCAAALRPCSIPTGRIQSRTVIRRLKLTGHAYYSRPSVARVVDEARPYRSFFPLGAPDRD